MIYLQHGPMYRKQRLYQDDVRIPAAIADTDSYAVVRSDAATAAAADDDNNDSGNYERHRSPYNLHFP